MSNPLTNREIEILTWIKQGKTSFETGKILGIAEPTVKSHLKNVCKKLNAANRTHAIAISIETDLLHPTLV